MARDAMPEVILTEAAERPGPTAGRSGTTSAERGGAHGRRRRRWFALALVAGLVLAINLVHEAGDRVRAERLAAVPRVLQTLSPPVVQLWERPSTWGQASSRNGQLVVGEPAAGGGVDVVSVHPASGLARWRAPVPEAGEGGGTVLSVLGGQSAGDRAYVAVRILELDAATEGRIGWAPPLGSLVVVLDGRTGERVLSRRVAGTSTLALGSVGEDLVSAQVLPDGRVRIEREPVGGGTSWTFLTPGRLSSPGARFIDLRVQVQHGVVVVTGPAGWALDAADGRLVREWPAPADAGQSDLEVTVLADGRFVAGRTRAAGPPPARYGTVSAGGGHERFGVPGPVLALAVDDGSAGDVLLTVPAHGGGIAAQRADDGAPLWTRRGTPAAPPVLLDGRLVSLVESHLEAVDVHDGRLLWRTGELGVRERADLLTDGDKVVVPTVAREPRTVLAAFDLADGAELWTAPLPAAMVRIETVDGHLIARGEASVRAFGAEGRG